MRKIHDKGSKSQIVVVDLKEAQPAKQVKRLRKGQGKLMTKVERIRRPVRVNAGAVISYVLSSPERTNYLSELCQGDTVTAVKANGDTRPLVVGRAKIETRPLLLVKAQTVDGEAASIMLQNDWRVRVLGRAGAVHSITELRAGSIILGYTAARARHVGMAVDEYCLEQ